MTWQTLNSHQNAQLAALVDLLAEDDHAPTGVREVTRVRDAHIADSLAGLELPALRRASRIADLGSGAGFPGLAIAVALPEARVALVESQRRRCEFLERVIAAVGISNAAVVCARAEEWLEGLSSCDAVLARALAAQAVVLEYAAPLLALGGVLVDWRGRRDAEAEAAGLRAAELLGLRRSEVRHVHPFEGALERHLHVFEKFAQTPERFPRRAGMARKRPLAR